MPPLPRPPSAPPPPRAPALPTVRILPARAEDSVALDGLREVPFVPWQRFVREVPFKQGDHITLIGRTRSGKTTLAVRGLLPMRQYVAVMATKQVSPSLYGPLQRVGYRITDDPALDYRKTPRVIFKPEIPGPSREDVAQQAEAFRKVLAVIFNEGRWALYMDELRYLSTNMGLRVELETLWLQGRELGITMIAATQNPVDVPRVAFDQVEHLFFWRQTERERVYRMGEMAGTNSDLVRAVIPVLPEHEALYVGPATDTLLRTRYPL